MAGAEIAVMKEQDRRVRSVGWSPDGRRLVTASGNTARIIDDYREAYGVEPICKVLPIAPVFGCPQEKGWGAGPDDARLSLACWQRFSASRRQ
jgi:hypothetical protein